MSSELAKTISTCAIWAATAVVLTFGLFRMNGSTEFFVFVTLIIAVAAAGATAAVWCGPLLAGMSAGQAPRLDTPVEQSTPPAQVPEEHGITRKPGG